MCSWNSWANGRSPLFCVVISWPGWDSLVPCHQFFPHLPQQVSNSMIFSLIECTGRHTASPHPLQTARGPRPALLFPFFLECYEREPLGGQVILNHVFLLSSRRKSNVKITTWPALVSLRLLLIIDCTWSWNMTREREKEERSHFVTPKLWAQSSYLQSPQHTHPGNPQTNAFYGFLKNSSSWKVRE